MSEEKNKNGLTVDWKTLPVADAELKVEQFRKDLFTLRLNARFQHNPSFSSSQRALKKEIARGLTYVNQVNQPRKETK